MKKFAFFALSLATTVTAQVFVPNLSHAASSSIDSGALDRSVSPCDDFYQFACGGWIAKTEIPSDRARWTRSFSTIDENNKKVLKDILTGLQKNRPHDATTRKLRDFYSACMDERSVEANSMRTLKKALAPIDSLQDKGKAFAQLLALLQLRGTSPLLNISGDQDMRDAVHVITTVDQGGLSLPDRDYYLSQTPKMQEVRRLYEESIVTMLKLIGIAEPQAKSQAATIMKIETALATASMDIVERRDPYKVYHKMSRTDLKAIAPLLDWDTFFAGLDLSKISSLNVAAPDFFKGLNSIIATTSLTDLKTYLRWQVYEAAMPAMGHEVVDAH